MTRLARIGLLVALLGADARAEQQRPVEIVLPRGGSRGSTVEVTLEGMDLANPREVLFYRPGIAADGFEALPPRPHPLGLAHDGKAIERVRARFAIASDCPLGEHPFRLRTGTGLSTLATFWVGPYPTVLEAEHEQGQDDTPDRAQPVPLGSTVSGRIHPSPRLDRDLYRVALRAGERLGVEVESVRLNMMAYGGSEYDLLARVLDAEGRELARDDDNGLHVQDPLLAIVAPVAGDYLVEIRQRIYRAHDYGEYRVHIGPFARPRAAYPLGGKAGEPMTVRFLGDAAGPFDQVVAVPLAPGPFDVFPGPEGHQPPSPMRLMASPFGNVLEVEPDDEARPAPAASLPIALNGVIAEGGDVDTFRIRAEGGVAYRVRVHAGSVGSLLDARVAIRRADDPAGPALLVADDSKLRDRDLFGLSNELQPRDLLDPSAVFTPDRSGDYLVTVADTRGMGGPEYVYRVEIEPAVDSVYVHVTSTAHDGFETNRVTGFIVPRGNRWTLNLLLGEGQGNRYRGDLVLEARGLPPGVAMIAPPVPAGARVVPVQFEADRSSPEGASLIEVVARAADPAIPLRSGSRQGVSFANQSGGHAFHSVRLDRFALAVTEPAPFRVELEPPRIALCQGGELALAVRVDRREGFDGAVDVGADWLPAGVAGEASVTISPGQAEGRFAVHADPRAVPGRYRIALNATTTGGLAYSGVGRVRASSAFVDLEVAAPYLTANLGRSAVERGRRAEVACDLDIRRPLPDRVEATLAGLPRGVKVVGPSPRIRAGDRRVVIPIEADADALVGRYPGVLCEILVEDRGQVIRQQAGTGVLRVDPSRGKTDAQP